MPANPFTEHPTVSECGLFLDFWRQISLVLPRPSPGVRLDNIRPGSPCGWDQLHHQRRLGQGDHRQSLCTDYSIAFWETEEAEDCAGRLEAQTLKRWRTAPDQRYQHSSTTLPSCRTSHHLQLSVPGSSAAWCLPRSPAGWPQWHTKLDKPGCLGISTPVPFFC